MHATVLKELLKELRKALRARAARMGTRRWRVVDDLVDHAFDKALDGLLLGRYPLERVTQIATRILDNGARSGPDRSELTAEIWSLIDFSVDSQPAISTGTFSPSDRARLLALLESKAGSLSPLEQRAVSAALECPTMASAADRAGVSRRNYRTLLGRAGRKLARSAARQATGNLARPHEPSTESCAPPPRYREVRRTARPHDPTFPRKRSSSMSAQRLLSLATLILGLTLFAAAVPSAAENSARVPAPAQFDAAAPSSVSIGEDCFFQGPTPDNEAGHGVISDFSDSGGNTSGAGCDDCTISSIKFRVTFPVAGAYEVFGGGVIPNQSFPSVPAGFETIISDSPGHKLDCGETASIVVKRVGLSGGSSLTFTCTVCVQIPG